MIVSAILFFSLKSIDQEPPAKFSVEFPALKAILTFNDIEERRLSVEFELSFRAVSFSGSDFTAYLSPKKIR